MPKKLQQKKPLPKRSLTKRELKRLIEEARSYSQKVLANQIKWPDPSRLLLNDYWQSRGDNGLTAFVLDLFWTEPLFGKRIWSAQFKGPGKIKRLLDQVAKQKTRWTNPAVVAREVKTYYVGVPYADKTGDLAGAAWNMENAVYSKVQFFAEAIKEIMLHFHWICLEEVSPRAVRRIASLTGYQGYCSYANSRGQAVGILLHPRLEVIKSGMYTDIADVRGIPDLRPAVWVTVRDKTSGSTFTIVVVHLKSMRGGVEVTSIVRCEQIEKLVQDLGRDFAGIVCGDFNFLVNDPSVKEAELFYQAGYSLVAKDDTRITQVWDSRLDAFFVKGMTLEIGCYEVRPYFLNPRITRRFSDHATISIHLLLAGTVRLLPGTTGSARKTREKTAGSQAKTSKAKTRAGLKTSAKPGKGTQPQTKQRSRPQTQAKQQQTTGLRSSTRSNPAT